MCSKSSLLNINVQHRPWFSSLSFDSAHRHIRTSFCKATSNVDHSSTASFCLSDAIHCCIQQPEQTCWADGATQFGFVCGWNTHGVQIFYEYLLILLKLVIWVGVNRSFQVGKIWSISSSRVIFKTLQVEAFSRHPYPSSARLPPSSPAVALASRDMRWNGWAVWSVCKPFLLSFRSFPVFMLSYFSIAPASEVLRLLPPSHPHPHSLSEKPNWRFPPLYLWYLCEWPTQLAPIRGSPLHTRVVFKQKIRLAASTFFAAHASGVYVRRFWKPGNNMKQPLHKWYRNKHKISKLTSFICMQVSFAGGYLKYIFLQVPFCIGHVCSGETINVDCMQDNTRRWIQMPLSETAVLQMQIKQSACKNLISASLFQVVPEQPCRSRLYGTAKAKGVTSTNLASVASVGSVGISKKPSLGDRTPDATCLANCESKIGMSNLESLQWKAQLNRNTQLHPTRKDRNKEVKLTWRQNVHSGDWEHTYQQGQLGLSLSYGELPLPPLKPTVKQAEFSERQTNCSTTI